jgi:hypothetical protein
MIIFLDFDGVLHPNNATDLSSHFSSLPLFENVLRKHPEVNVVISSTWRKTHTLEQLKSLFSYDIATRVIGLTPPVPDDNLPFSLLAYARHAEIETWLRREGRACENWIALDDKPWLFRPFLRNLLPVPGENGLTPPGVRHSAASRLNSAHSAPRSSPGRTNTNGASSSAALA